MYSFYYLQDDMGLFLQSWPQEIFQLVVAPSIEITSSISRVIIYLTVDI